MSLESHSPIKQPNLETSEMKEAHGLADKKDNPWARLIGRSNEEQIVINGHPVTALLDTGSQVTHISKAFCQANNIQIQCLVKLVEIEGTGGDLIKYIGYIEATLTLPLGSQSFGIEALLLVLPSTDYQQRVPIAIGTTITDMAVDFINKFKPENLPKSWKAVCCATQSKWLIQAQPENKYLVKTTKPVTLPPFSTTTKKGSTKLRSHGMRLNLIAEPSNCTQLPASVQCTPTYCTLEPGSNRVSMGIKNISSRAITIPSRVVVGRLQQAKMVPDDQSSKPKQDPTGGRGGSWILDQLNLEGLNSWTGEQQQSARDLLVDSADVFAKTDLDLGKCNIIKHAIKITDPQPFKEHYRRIPPHLYEEVKAHLQEMVEVGAIRKSFSPWASAVVLVRKKDGGLRFCIDLRKLNSRTVKDGYSLPRIEDTLDCLHGAVWFSTLDLKSGYWQVELEEEAKPLTAFTVGPLGFWECECMPFGLTNAPATFQRLMESCLGELHLNWCIIYLDDIIVFSRTPEEHIHRLRAVFEKLKAAGLKLKPSNVISLRKRSNIWGMWLVNKGSQLTLTKLKLSQNGLNAPL